MELLLRALRCPATDRRAAVAARFGIGGGTVGRSSSCTLALDGTDKHVSREHVRIDASGGGFFLHVVSRINGVLLNGQFVPPGGRVPLGAGDRWTLGDYEFAVERLNDPGMSAWQAGPSDPLDSFALSDAAGRDWWMAPPAPRPLAAAAAAPMAEPQAAGSVHVDPFAALDALWPDAAGPSSDRIAQDPVAAPALTPAPTPSPSPSPLPAPPGPMSPRQPAMDGEDVAGETARDALRTFVSAAGLQVEDLGPADPRRVLHLAGNLLRLSIGGLVTLLAARGQERRDLPAAHRTAIATRANNPLKHAGSPQAALQFLLDERQHAHALFMPPEAALTQAVADLQVHQASLVAGLQAAVVGAWQAVSPAQVGRCVSTLGAWSGALDAALPARQKARLWDAFVVLHAQRMAGGDAVRDQVVAQALSESCERENLRPSTPRPARD